MTGKPRRMATVATLCVAVGVFASPLAAFAADEPSPSATAVSTVVSATPTPTPTETAPAGTVPASPTKIRWTRLTKTSVELNWSAPQVSSDHDEATSYIVETTKDGVAINGGSKVTGTSKIYKNIDPKTVLTTSVTAVNEFGASDAVEGPKWTQPAVVPSAPASVTVMSVTSNTIKVSWTAPDDDGGAAVSAYVVRLYEGKDIYYEQTLDVVSTSDSFANLLAGSTYHVEVIAVNSAGKSPAKASRDIDLPKVTTSPRPTPTKTIVITPSAPTVAPATPTPSDTQLQQDIDGVRARQAALEAQQQQATTWLIVGVILALLIAAVIGLIFVIRHNRKVDAYNRARNLHG